jgi:hypothetical protein
MHAQLFYIIATRSSKIWRGYLARVSCPGRRGRGLRAAGYVKSEEMGAVVAQGSGIILAMSLPYLEVKEKRGVDAGPAGSSWFEEPR